MLKSLTKTKPIEILFIVILSLFFVSRFDIPHDVSLFFDNILTKIALIVIAIFLLLNASIVLAILFIIVVFDILFRSQALTSYSQQHHEEKKSAEFSNLNHTPFTLEQEVVQKMAPLVNSGKSPTLPGYSTSKTNTHSADKCS